MAINPDRKKLKELYLPPQKTFTLVDVPEMPFMTLDGAGDPEDASFATSVKWIWTAIHPLRLLGKTRMGKNFIEPPLECLWWADDMRDFIEGRKEAWKWRLMIAAPVWARDEMFRETLDEAAEKLGPVPDSLTLRPFAEGRCVQIMNVGGRESIATTAAALYRDYLPAEGLIPSGPYHEIYLNDPNRVAPEKWKTVLRQPVKGSGEL